MGSNPPLSAWSGAELLSFAFATFNLVVLLMMVLIIGFASGEVGSLLAPIGTAPGLAAFGLLWLWTWRCVRQSIVKHQFIDQIDLRDALTDGLRSGGVEGVGILLALLIGVDIATLVSDGIEAALGLLVLLGIVAVIGGLVAFAVGAAVGVLFAAIDALLLALSLPASFDAGVAPRP